MRLNALRISLLGISIALSTTVRAHQNSVIEGETFAILHQQGEQGAIDAKAVAQSLDLVISESIPELGIYVFNGSANHNVSEQVSNHPFVKSANPHHYTYPALTPNDPEYTGSAARQGALKQTNPESAWDRGLGTDVVVAVLDTGVDFNHPDLQENLLEGYDYIENQPIRSGSVDLNGHGTHIAGIIAGVMNNNLGITGIAPKAKILPVRVLNETKGTSYNRVNGTPVITTIQGIQYAAQYAQDNDINVVINTSFGATSEQNYCTAIQQALNERVLMVAAAMNGNTQQPHFPADCDGVIAVASVNASNQRAPYSNYGQWIDISAPGSSVYSTWRSGNYQFESGTSMATGFVSGAIAVLLSANNEQQPNDIKDLVLANTSPIEGSDSALMGTGQLNLSKAMAALPELPDAPSPPKAPTLMIVP